MKLNINDQEYRLVWGLVAINKFCEAVGQPEDWDAAFNIAFPSVDSNVKVMTQWNARAELLLAALKSGAELDGESFNMTKNQILHWVDETPQEKMDEVWADFIDSQIQGISIKSILFQSVEKEDEAPKKKSR